MSSSVTDGMDIRILATEARVGDLLVIANGQRVDSTIVEIRHLPVGHIVRGPRGGGRRLLVPAVSLRTRSGHNPVFFADRPTTITVYRAEA